MTKNVIALGLLLIVQTLRLVKGDSKSCCPCSYDISTKTPTTKAYTTTTTAYEFPHEEKAVTTFKQIGIIINNPQNKIPEDEKLQIMTLINSYKPGTSLPPGMLDLLQQIIVKYKTTIQTTQYTELKILIQEVQQVYGGEKTTEFVSAYTNNVSPEVINLIIMIQDSSATSGGYSHTMRKCEELEKYLIEHKTTISTQIVQAIYQIFESYGYAYSTSTGTMAAGESFLGTKFISYSELLQALQLEGSMTFKVSDVNDCNPENFCTESIMTKVCVHGGGRCKSSWSWSTNGVMSVVMCSIAVIGCRTEPQFAKLTTHQIIEGLLASGTTSTWVDHSSECAVSKFCNNPEISKSVAPLGGGQCLTKLTDRSCRIEWKGMKVLSGSINSLPTADGINFLACTVSKGGCEFKVSSRMECESYCERGKFPTGCTKHYTCCVNTEYLGDGIVKCNIKHTCRDSLGSDYSSSGDSTGETIELSASDLISREESVNIPEVLTYTTSKNVTIFQELEPSKTASGSDYSDFPDFIKKNLLPDNDDKESAEEDDEEEETEEGKDEKEEEKDEKEGESSSRASEPVFEASNNRNYPADDFKDQAELAEDDAKEKDDLDVNIMLNLKDI